MSTDSFEAPSLELLAALLPAYDFEAFIAQGGMGAVYKARQRSLDRDVAIKILPRELGEDPEFRQSFETEAKAMARLNHPNLIGVYDYGDVDGMPYIVMEFVNGKSLFHSAYQLKVDPVQAVTIVKGICEGLAHAHENGVIHRDIKPANILLNEKVVPKIGDFGLARPVDSDGSGIVMGTPGYVAPEVLRHPDQTDRRSDLFALGVVLYELLIGRCPPYDYQPPASTVCGCDVTLDRICDKAMHRVAEMRYQSAEEMSADLDAWLRRASAPAAAQAAGPVKRPSRIRRVAPAGSYQTSGGSDSSGVKGLLMLAAAVVVVAVGWSKYNSGEKAKAAALQAAAAENQPAVEKKADPVKEGAKKDYNASIAKKEKEKERKASPLGELGRLRQSLHAGKRDEMPEGSVEHGETRLMVVPKAMTWSAAATFARMHGARLFVAKSPGDLKKLAGLMPAAEDGAEAGVWVGAGNTAAGQWSWVDGSEWSLGAKPEGDGAYVIVDATGGVQARARVDRYPFVIQWLNDGSSPTEVPDALVHAGEGGAMDPASASTGAESANEADEVPMKDLPQAVADLDAKAKAYLENIGKDRDKELAANVKAFTWDIDSWHKGLGKSEQSQWNRDVTVLKAMISGVRVPAKVGPNDGIRLSAQMLKVSERCAEKQKSIEAAYNSKAEKARASYATRMSDQVKELGAGANAAGSKAAEARVKKAAELKGWLAFITGEGPIEEEMVKASSPVDGVAGDISGRWVWLSREIIVVKPDGSLLNETNKKKGTWRLVDAGRYEMSWNKGEWKDMLGVSTSGNELDGRNQNGDNISGWRILPGSDPIVDAWKWGPAICVFRPDNTVLKGPDKGVWSLDSEEGKKRSYTVRWQSGWVDNFSISGDADEFEGTNNTGNKITGERVKG